MSFTTNGSLLHKFKEELERLPRVHLGISVDGASSETYEKIRVGAKWAEVSANVEWFSEQRRFHRPLWDTSRLAFVIMKSNYEEIPAFVEWARTLEMPVLFCPVWGEFAPGENIFDHPELCAGLTSTSQIIAKAEGIAEKMPIYERTETIKSLRHSLEKLPH